MEKSGQSLATRATVASVVLTGLLAILAVPYFFAAMFSVMMFDAPGSTSNPWVWLAFLAVCLYPLLLITATVSAWVLLARSRHVSAFRVAVGGSILAVVPVGIFLLL